MSEAPRLRIVRGEDAPEPPPRDPQDPGFDPDAGSKGSAKAEPDERPAVQQRTGKGHLDFRAGLEALQEIKGLYARGERLSVVLGKAGNEMPLIHQVTPGWLWVRLQEVRRWQRWMPRGDKLYLHDAAPSDKLLAALLENGRWPGVDHVEALTTTPIIRPDGSVQWEEGYDRETGAYYASVGDVLPQTKPDRASAVACRKRLLDVVGDFCWASPLDAEVWLAGLLAPLVRCWCGPCPITLFTATTPSSGKSVCADIIGAIIGGRGMARMAWTYDNEELRKRLVSMALAGDQIVLWDNLANGSSLTGPVVDMAATAERVYDRALSKNEMIDAPLKACWYATGNNISVPSDTGRRVLLARMTPTMEHPEDWTGYRVKRIVRYCRKLRPELASAAVTILQAYLLAGSPDQPSVIGSFEGWSEVVRSAIIWAGGDDVAKARANLAPGVDVDADIHRQLLIVWRGLFRTGGSTIPRAIDLCPPNGEEAVLGTVLAELAPERGGKIGSARRIGREFTKYRGRVREVEGCKLVLERREKNAAGMWVWVVGEVGNLGDQEAPALVEEYVGRKGQVEADYDD